MNEGWAVSAIDDERSGSWSQVPHQVQRRGHDLTALSKEQMRELLEGADVLFHLAAEKHRQSLEHPESVLEVNVSATSRLFRAAREANVGRVVFTSSVYAYGSLGPELMVETDLAVPNTTYGVSKLAGEHLLRVANGRSGLSWAVARLFFVFGTRQHVMSGYTSVIHRNFERVERGEQPIIFGDGKQSLDYVYIDDCVDALIALALPEHDGLTVNIASGNAISISDLTNMMLDVAGARMEPVHAEPDWTAGSVRAGSPNLARERLGWEPRTSVEEGLSRVWRWRTSAPA